MAAIRYRLSDSCGKKFRRMLVQRIQEHGPGASVCDIGGGANPVLCREFIRLSDTSYTLLDVSQAELDKAPSEFNKLCADITDFEKIPADQWDIVFSTSVAEHIEDGEAFHRSIFRALKPGGTAMHLFPTLYAFPFVLNRLLPEKLSSLLLDRLLPRDRYQHDKFPAYYSWCLGPTPSMINRLQSVGYEIDCFYGLFGHRYFRFLPPLQWLQNKIAAVLVKHPVPYLTSYAILVVKKPEIATNARGR